MTDTPSGTYVIDSDFRIVSYNQVALELYPQLVKGEKCHKCLMGLDEPCSVCPVANQVKGPKTYFDPIREIYETVDAVPFYAGDSSQLYALVFSTTGQREEFARQLPTTEAEFNFLYEQEYHDHLTGGLSQKGFSREAARILRESGPDEQFAMLYFNIKNFKAINDLFGFDSGDLLLRQSYMETAQSPFPPKVVARIMADHFVCLVDQKCLNYDFICKSAMQSWNCAGRSARIHSSCGIFLIDDKTLPVSGMIDRARIAHQHIVDEYVKPYAIFDAEMRKEYIDKAQVLAECEDAVRDGQFVPYYQPVMQAASGRVNSAEILIRWQHPEKGLIMPGSFIPVLEKNGYITKLDRYMIETVHAQLLERWQQGLPIVPVSLNLSWMDFYDDSMQAFILDLVRHSPLPRGTLNFETTETAFNTMESACKRFLDALRGEGCRILLDDFGAGYSSMGMIEKYDFDILKIDMKFIRQIKTSPKARNIICAVIAMCNEIGIQAVAEGVEEQAEYEFLRLNDCDYIQGYYYSKPLDQEKFFHFVEQHVTAQEKAPSYLEAFATEHVADMPDFTVDSGLLQLVLNNSESFIQICDPETMEMHYANSATRQISGHPQQDYRGQKCYEYMLGLDEMCPHCPLRQMGEENERKLEVDDGKYVYALNASFVQWRGKRLFLEVGMDITEQKKIERKYDAQIQSILRSMPEEQGIFHIDVTDDRWLSSSGNAKNARDLQNLENVEMLIRQISLFIPDEEKRVVFFNTFCRESLLRAFEEGKEEITLETCSYYDDMSIRATRMIACLAENPKTGNVEAIIHGLDISKEKSDEERLAQQMEQAITDAQVKLAKADHDRRVDFLTGLCSRLDLFERLQAALEGTQLPIEAMYMMDVDDFKSYNDLYGRVAGDKCLQSIAQALKEYGKANDIVFYRYGGEEFLGVGSQSRKPAAQIAKEIVETVAGLNLTRTDNQLKRTTVSLGFTTDNSRYEKMIDRSDSAMYRAKALGKNCWVCCEEM